MDIDSYKFKIVILLTIAFGLASLLAYLCQRIRIPSILGYLIAGYVIGPYSPGFVMDIEVSEQLAEIGVILMLFSVGLHFNLSDLVNVKNVALPGALIQTLVAALCGTLFIYHMGWPIEYGIIIGLAIGVASTVVMVRMLTDHHLLNTVQGHISVGWLVVEDILTVAVLLLLPLLSTYTSGGELSTYAIVSSITIVFLKFILLAVVMFTWGRKIVSRILFNVARIRSHELFTLTILALTFIIAIGSAVIFGVSIALGAFIAGMVIGQTEVRHQAAANALPMKDAFSVLFFLAVGMLFNPATILYHPFIFLGILVIILLIKPLTALLIVLGYRLPLEVALVVAISLAQIGEFSFILGEEASRLDLLSDEGYDIIVACALASIFANPLLFKVIDYFKTPIQQAAASMSSQNKTMIKPVHSDLYAIVVGFGPIGQNTVQILENKGFNPIVIDRNLDTIAQLTKLSRPAVYGDASLPEILKSSYIDKAAALIITIPDTATVASIIEVARHLNPKIKILAHTQYVVEEQQLSHLNIQLVCSEEETNKAFSYAVHKLAREE